MESGNLRVRSPHQNGPSRGRAEAVLLPLAPTDWTAVRSEAQSRFLGLPIVPKRVRPAGAKPARKRSSATGTLVGVRLQDDEIKAIDSWARKQEPPVTRPYAIRRLVEIGLKAKEK